jgi:hypothetical protein
VISSATAGNRLGRNSLTGVPEQRPLSAIPPVAARVIGLAAILLGGLAGALIGYALVDLQCDGDCSIPKGLGLLGGALMCAGGMAIVSVLALRAMGEWREIADRQQAGHAPR